MKRQTEGMESLVYAYGCGKPIEGLDHAEAEMKLARAMWDRCVQADRDSEAALQQRAAADVPEIAELLAKIAAESGAIRVLAGMGGDDAKAARKAAVEARRAARRALWPLMTTWAKEHKNAVDENNAARWAALTQIRQSSGMYWGNYNRVLDAYSRSRVACRKMGRRLQMIDPDRDDGCLTVQIQRTASGLGATLAELQSGRCGALRLGIVDPRAHDEHVFRGERRRLCLTTAEMRLDEAGHMIRLPLWFHRPLPADARVKAAQLTWTSTGGRRHYQLCLTLSRPVLDVQPEGRGRAEIEIGWTREHERGPVTVMTVRAQPENRCDLPLELPYDWLAGMDRVEWLQKLTADALKTPMDTAAQRLYRQRLRRMYGERARLLRHRREIYRLAARRLAMTYAEIVLPDTDYAALAMAERGEERNSLRHRVAPHLLVGEIKHQAHKHGATLTLLDVASAPARRRTRAKKIKVVATAGIADERALATSPSSD